MNIACARKVHGWQFRVRASTARPTTEKALADTWVDAWAGGGAGCGATGRVGGGAGCCGRTDARMIRGPLCSSDWKIEMPKRTLSFLWNWRSTWTRQEGLYSGIVSYFIVKPKTAKIPSW